VQIVFLIKWKKGENMINATINIRTDRELKTQAQTLFNMLGIDMTTAVNMFLRQAVINKSIPFEVCDPFFNEKNQKRLARSIADAQAGKLTVHELIEEY
jgi:DNA-damage-inducible protein J